MATSKTIRYTGETRNITMSGTPGAEFEIYVKQGTNYYNWDTDSFQSTEKRLKFQEIPANGIYSKTIIIPTVTSNTTYDFYVVPLAGTNSSVFTGHAQKIGTLYQKGKATATFTATESSTLVVQNSGSAGSDLTGGTITSTSQTLTQTGTITEASGNFVYIHSVPTWNALDGGNWTLANTITTTVKSKNGTSVVLDDATGIASGYAIVGKNIIDEITVSAISGNKITLSADQRLQDGDELTFSKGAWEIGPLSAKVTSTSGTASVTMDTIHNVSKVGIADITCVLDVDAFASVKPNAFPISANCPAGGSVAINVVESQDGFIDTDANQATKAYKVHSVPSASTASPDPIGTYGVVKNTDGDTLSADSSLGSTGAGTAVYHAHADMVAGDTDYFYYKCIDAQSSPVTSSTTQGKISITIV